MKYFYIITLLFLNYIQGNDNSSTLTINTNIRSEAIIAIDSQTHIDYGLSYPITYEFTIPSGSYDLRSYRKFQYDQEWSQILEQTSNDFFNGIEAVRFDYDNNIAYVSIGFSDISDSIFIKITDNESNIVESTYSQMSQYYDNRDAVVTSTADDWGAWSNPYFVQTCEIFRSFNLWISPAIITDFLDSNSWSSIQNQLDLGFVEPVAHSRTHPHTPYENIESEVLGCKQDLIQNLNMPIYNRYGSNEYIYAWIAPYGEYSDEIDTAVSDAKYLISRLFYENQHGFSNWDQSLMKFEPVGASIELGGYYYWTGSTDTIELNHTFDDILTYGGIYHLMSHPAIIDWENDVYPWVHLEHISNRKNIWYVGFGHLYAYHFIQSAYQNMNLHSSDDNLQLPHNFLVYQNYPNPFNPVTTLRYDLPEDAMVNITIYDMMGRVVSNLVSSQQRAGYKSIQWNATNKQGQPVSAGVYLYKIQAGDFVDTKKMILLK
jgi:hypothetical protein